MENVRLFIDYTFVFKNTPTFKAPVWESDIDFSLIITTRIVPL